MIKLYCSIRDLLIIFLHADFFSKKKIGKLGSGRKLRILGNGKSLNDERLEDDENVDYMVVNRHVLADNYQEIRPRYYVLADPHFFNHEEGISVMHKIDEKTSWDMSVFVPFGRRTAQKWKNEFKNDRITLKTYNSFPFLGFERIAYSLFDCQLAMPLVQNVLVASIMLGLQMEYDVIELYGVEHSWTKYLFVGDDNVVYLDNPHFYDREKSFPKPFKEIQHTAEFPMWLALECYMNMFKSYSVIREYVVNRHIDSKIVNKTPHSFIDAFERE